MKRGKINTAICERDDQMDLTGQVYGYIRVSSMDQNENKETGLNFQTPVYGQERQIKSEKATAMQMQTEH